MSFNFKAGPPKRSRQASLNTLTKIVEKEGVELTGVKNVDAATNLWLVYGAGDENYYVIMTAGMLKFLQAQGLEV